MAPSPCPRFEIRTSRNKLMQKRWRVVLIAANCEVLNVSESLNSLAAAHTNIAAVRKVVPESEVYVV